MIEQVPRQKVIIIAVLVSVLVILLLAAVYPVAERAKLSLFSPLRKPLRAASQISAKLESPSPGEKPLREKQRLEGELQNLTSRLEEISRENERLRILLDFKKESPRRMLAARIIGRDISNWSRTVIIDRGINESLGRGMPVIAEGALAGKIIASDSRMSKVMLLTDPDSRIACLIQESRQSGLVEGTVGGKLFMKYIDLNAEVEPGELVITSGFGKTYPKGLIVGRVGEVVPDNRGLYKCAWILPQVNFSRLEEVLVIVE